VLRRYGVASLLIIIVAMGTAGLAYKVGSKLTYTSYCTMQVFVRAPATATPPPNPDFQTFTNSLAANEVNAATPKAYVRAAQSLKMNPGVLASKTRLLPARGIAAFAISVADDEPKRAQRIADATCTAFVSVIIKQRAEGVNDDLTVIQKRIDGIQADLRRLERIPESRRTDDQTLDLLTQQQALKNNAFLVAAYKSLAPDKIGVLLPATNAAATRSASLKKYVLVALVAALLAIFLFILVGEALSSPQRGGPPFPDSGDVGARESQRTR
jgi:hypothetical protein